MARLWYDISAHPRTTACFAMAWIAMWAMTALTWTGSLSSLTMLAQTVLPFAASHGLSLAGCMFVINSATGFYQHVHNRSVTESCARALFGLLFGLPLAYMIFSLMAVAAMWSW